MMGLSSGMSRLAGGRLPARESSDLLSEQWRESVTDPAEGTLGMRRRGNAARSVLAVVRWVESSDSSWPVLRLPL